MIVKLILPNGRTFEMPTNVLAKILSMALSTMMRLEKEEGFLPPLELKAKNTIITLQTRDTSLI